MYAKNALHFFRKNNEKTRFKFDVISHNEQKATPSGKREELKCVHKGFLRQVSEQEKKCFELST
jgi:hypothetical protein